ncbi:hypothetical protein [Halomarina rubra]|uniref:DUF8052 domain-containing protein n=1 Tax=Halomarina rubra TaxID=2071873 RepID=A0ABD6AYP6_9EURY|nr:hypothetical protein [Halomarina rubra]
MSHDQMTTERASDRPAGTPDEEAVGDCPTWDDPYLDRVAASLQFNYDLASDERVHGTTFDLYGLLEIDSHKQFLHPAISFGHQYSYEHLYVDRRPRVTVADLEALVELGHDLAEDLDHDEEHYATEFTFVVVVDDLPDDAASFVAGHQERTMLKYGYHGHYEVNLVAVVPDDHRVVAADVPVADAFDVWDDTTTEGGGVLDRLKGLF